MHKVLNIFISLIFIAIGTMVMAGWLLHIPIMVQFKFGLVPMVFNTALCFPLTGITLLLDNLKTDVCVRTQTTIAAFLTVLCNYPIAARYRRRFRAGLSDSDARTVSQAQLKKQNYLINA
jgi:hypothetical protein